MMLFLSAQIIMPITLLGILFTFIYIYRFVQRRRKRRSPFTDSTLLRPPGYTLNKEIEELSEKLNEYVLFIFFSSMVLIHMIIVMAMQKGVAPYPNRFPLYYGLLIICVGVALYKIFKSLRKRDLLVLGYEGELITAQELHKLMPEGNYVYHDFYAENFNIDHIVVGPAGVFAIETKSRSKRTSGNQFEEAKAEYNGKEIAFPDFKDRSYLDQARRQAKWLSKWLTSAVGEHIDVFPVVSIPGWRVERKTGYDGTFVVNPKLLKTVIRPASNHHMDDKKIRQINHQLEAKCSDIEIRSKQYDK